MLFMVGGAAGYRAGRHHASAQGPGALLHYPPPLTWMRGRLMSAKWVQRIGLMYLLAGLCLMVTTTAAGLLPGERSAEPMVCTALAKVLSAPDWTPAVWQTRDAREGQEACAIHLVAPEDGTRWFTIRMWSDGALVTDHYRHQLAMLERQGMSLKPLNGMGERAVLASPRSAGQYNPRIVISREGGLRVIEMNPRVLAPAQVTELLRASDSISM